MSWGKPALDRQLIECSANATNGIGPGTKAREGIKSGLSPSLTRSVGLSAAIIIWCPLHGYGVSALVRDRPEGRPEPLLLSMDHGSKPERANLGS